MAMRNTILSGVIGLMPFAGVATAQDDPVSGQDILPISIIAAGDYHEEEVANSPVSGWLALIRRGDGSALVDAEDGPFTGKRVTTAPSTGVVVLLQGGGLRTGRINEAQVTGSLSGLSAKTIAFAGKTYSLDARGACDDRRDPCAWTLSQGTREQVLASVRASQYTKGVLDTDSEKTGLLWAGDLDADGKLDLVIDVSDHENASANIRVFLSSQAEGLEIVGEAGVFDAVGC
jgi:hypothetical protein